MRLSVFPLGLLVVACFLWNPATAQTWKELLDRADSLSNAWNQDSAIFIGKLSLEKAKREFGESDTTVARILNRIGTYNYNKADYSEAESLYKQALSIREKILGPSHPDVAKSLFNLALLYKGQNRYIEAERLYQRSLTIMENALGTTHPNVARGLNSLALLYLDQGKYAEAEPLLRQALAVREKTLGPEHPDVAEGLNSLALLYWEQGKYAEAEPLFKRSLIIREKVLGSDNTDVAASLNGLANLYADQGKYTEAELLFQRSLTIWKKALGPEHPDIAKGLHNMASLYHEQGLYTEAESLYKQALTIKEKALGPDHVDLTTSINNLALLYEMQGRYSEAEPLYRRALTIKEKYLGPDHPDVAQTVNNIAALFIRQSRHTEAKPLLQRSLTTLEKSLGANHPHVAVGLESFSEFNRLIGQTEKSLSDAGRSFKIRIGNLRDGSSVMSEKDALTYSKFMRTSANNYLSCFLDAKKKDTMALRNTGNVVFSAKGQVTDEMFVRQQVIVKEKDKKTLDLAENLRLTRFQLAKLWLQGPDKKDLKGYRRKLDSLSRLKNDLEARLARRSAGFRKRLDYQKVNTQRIASLLPEKSVLVEYLKYDYLQLKPDTAIPHYLVLVLDKTGLPAITDLGKASKIESLIAQYRRHMEEVTNKTVEQKLLPGKNDTEEYKKLAQRLYGLVWKPVEKYAAGKSLIFIAPDGGLNLVPFAGLVDSSGAYLVEKYPIHYLASGRDLIRLKDAVPFSAGLLAMGDPDYSAKPGVRVSQLAQTKMDTSFSVTSSSNRNVRSDCDWLKTFAVWPLPGTRTEIERIVQDWKGPKEVYYDERASEEIFKSRAPNHQVIHIATHGYYLQDKCLPKVTKRSFGMEERFIGENPLLLSGLLLAGANLHGHWADSAGAEDGILTAEEVAGMNLNGTKMVVLSACETGLGEVKQGEGIYGLRRAFQMAGARTVISALWKVPDEITAETLGKLYASKGISIPQTLRLVQLEQIKKLRKQKDPDHPFSWGAFIAIGDWR